MRLLDGTDLYLLTIATLVRPLRWTRSRRMCDAVGSAVARVASSVPGDRRRLRLERLASCVGDRYTPRQLGEALRQTYRTFWQDAFALALPALPASTWKGIVEVQGMEHLEEALARKQGALLLESSYFGRRNLSKILLNAHGIDVLQVHAQDHIAGFASPRETRLRQWATRPFFERLERRFVREILHLSGRGESLVFTRRLVSLLRDNQVVCSSGEGNIGQRRIRLPFLGSERAFVTGMMNLGKHSGAPILPLFCWRDGARITLAIEAPLELQGGSTAAEAGAVAYSRLLEEYILRCPAEYYGWGALPASV